MCSCLKKINKIKQYKHQRNKKHIVFSFLRIPFDRVYNVKTVLLAILRHSSTLKVQPLYLQLCDQYSGYGTLHCYIGKGSCPGSANGNCFPNHVWSSTLISGTSYYALNLNSGGVDTTHSTLSNRYATHAFAVRCVLDLKYFRIKMFQKMSLCLCNNVFICTCI